MAVSREEKDLLTVAVASLVAAALVALGWGYGAGVLPLCGR